MRYVVFLLLVTSVYAFQIPFYVPNFLKKHVLSPSTPKVEVKDDPPPAVPGIAIIGAGAGGSSAAFWISKAKSRFGLDVEVDVYDRNNYIGGRSTVVYPYNDTTLGELELGASIFVRVNKNLWRASEEFNLTRRDFAEEDYAMGLWDGQDVRFTFEGGWWGTLKVLWRYGIKSPKRAQDIVAEMIKTYVGLYSKDTPKWDNVTHLSTTYGWTELTGNTTMEYLVGKGVSPRYVSELIEAATRTNYGQNVDYLHALEGMCSLATTGAAGISGGNYQIFEQFLRRSGATVHLNTNVNSILPSADSDNWAVTTSQGTKDYAAVILAAPFHFTDITVPRSISKQIPQHPYVHLHVTLLTTTSEYPNPAYFNLPSSSKPARMMLTTYEGARHGGPEPEFNSLTYHGLVRPGEWAVKIFSKARISDQLLDHIFNGQVKWVFRKEWDAYPKLPPTESFPPVKLGQGLYYTNSFEPFISTMETETLSSRNIVDLLLNDIFNSSLCGPQISNITIVNEDDYVYGWDC